MFTNEIFYKMTDWKYRRPRKSLVRVVHDDANLNSAEYFREQRVRQVRKNQIEDTPQNREWCFWNETILQSMAYIISNAITGTGIRVKTEDKEAERIINAWNKKVNAAGDTIEGAITSWVIDNIIHGYAAWRILLTNEEEKIDIGRLNPRDMVKVTSETTNWTKYIQRTNVETTNITSKAKWMKNYRPAISTMTGTWSPMHLKIQTAHIPLEATISIDLFLKPPIMSVLTLVVFKKWILLFMRKAAEKFWSPSLIGTLGTEDDHPDDEEVYEENIANFTDMLTGMHVFKALGLPYNAKVESLDMTNSNVDLVGYMKYLDDQMAQSVLTSTGLVNPTGSELATNRAVVENFLRTIQAFRHVIGTKLDLFYTKKLLPANNHKDPGDIELDFSHLKESTDVEYVAMTCQAFDRGAFKNYGEFVKALKVIWPWLVGESGDNPPKYLKKFLELGQNQQPIKQPGGSSKVDLADKNRPTHKTEPKGSKVNK